MHQITHKIESFVLPTANRGDKEFVVSIEKSGHLVHELGGLTQWARITGNGEREARGINPTVRYGNQHRRGFKYQPFTSIHSARIAATIYANQTIIR